MAMAQQEELRNRLIHVNCPRDNYENLAEVMQKQWQAQLEDERKDDGKNVRGEYDILGETTIKSDPNNWSAT